MWNRILWWRRKQEEKDLDDEIRAHLAIEARERSEPGARPEDAEFAARRAFGNRTQIAEQTRDVWRLAWLEDLWQDIRYGARTLRRSPGFTAMATLTLALGIGVNTAIFSMFNGVLLQPLPYPESHRLVRIFENIPGSDTPLGRPQRVSVNAFDLRELRGVASTLSDIDVYGTSIELRLGHDEDRELPGARVSLATLSMLGAKPVLGRLFDARESTEMEPVLILSHSAWRQWFAADPQVLGRSVAVEGTVAPPYGLPRRVYTVIGVMAEGFQFPSDDTQFWVPLNIERDGGGANIARLASNTTVVAATDEVNALLRERRPARAGEPAMPRFEVIAIQDEMAASIRPALRVLFVAVGLVLLIACANVANLLLARATVREREMSVRHSLGAARGRLVRQMMTEGAVLSALGGVVGLLFASGGIRLLRVLLAGLAPEGNVRQVGIERGPAASFPSLDAASLDLTALLFTAAICLAMGVFFGLAPALSRSNRRPMDVLRAGEAASAGGFGMFRRNAGRSLLVAGQIALAVTLLVAGGLLIHSFVRLVMSEKGYDPRNVLTFQIRAPRGHFNNRQLRQFSEDLVARVETLPGVRAAAYGLLPLVSFIQSAGLQTSPGESLPPQSMSDNPYSLYYPELRLVSPKYPDVLGMRIVEGRSFSGSGESRQVRSILINETLARGRFAGVNPVGRQVYLAGESWEIRGVVADVHQQGLDVPPTPQVFVNFAEWPSFNEIADDPRYYSVRTSGEPMAALAGVREILRQTDGEILLDNVRTMESLAASSIARPRLYAVLLGSFAGLALLLAAVGIYGVMSYAVTQNTREIGLRIALGARPQEVLRMILRRAAALAGVGLTVGIAAAAAASRYLQGMIFGLTPLDLPTYLAAAAFFLLVALTASYIPARRAARVDPLVALRTE